MKIGGVLTKLEVWWSHDYGTVPEAYRYVTY